jgi:hypothetical protein
MNSSQLSLFNTNTATGNVYRAGDWVKVRKKPAIAAWVKRDEIFQINQVHPIDGSLKFWNPHIKQWDFLYPEEVKLTVESVVGEIPELTVESVVGEASELIVESVVGEVPELIVESVVGEVKTPKNYWNCNKGHGSNGWLESHYKIRRGGKQHSIKCPEIGCTGPYYSYRWMDRKQQRAKYCPASKCPAVRKAVLLGQPISEILEIITSNQ